MKQAQAKNPIWNPEQQFRAAPTRVPQEARNAMDCSDIAGSQPQSKIRPLGRPPVHSSTNVHKVEQPRKQIQTAGFNILNHTAHSQSRPERD